MFERDLEFYTLETDGLDFCEILGEIYRKPAKNVREGGRVLKVGTANINLTKLKEEGDYCEGLIVRAEKEDLPFIGNVFRNFFEILKLKKNEGLIDMTFFCYIKSLKVICLLPAKKGVKWGTFKHYIQSIHNLKNRFDIFPLINKKAMDKFRNMGSITLLEASLDIGNNSQPTSSRTQQTPLGEFIQETKNAQATRLKVELFNGKKKGGLRVSSIRELVNILRRVGILYEARSIKIRGSQTPEDNDMIIDLIKERYRLQIKLGDKSRSLNFDECCRKVHSKIEDNLEDISELIE